MKYLDRSKVAGPKVLAEKGKELGCGIGSYGHHTHNVHYTLTRLVKSYTDYDGFIFTFYQAAAPYAQNMHVTIKAEGKTLTTENTRVWSFKHYGTIYVTEDNEHEGIYLALKDLGFPV